MITVQSLHITIDEILEKESFTGKDFESSLLPFHWGKQEIFNV